MLLQLILTSNLLSIRGCSAALVAAGRGYLVMGRDWHSAHEEVLRGMVHGKRRRSSSQ